jgi:hypothetical protein
VALALELFRVEGGSRLTVEHKLDAALVAQHESHLRRALAPGQGL